MKISSLVILIVNVSIVFKEMCSKTEIIGKFISKVNNMSVERSGFI